MKNKPILIIAGEPFGVFFEIFFKSFKKKIIQKSKYPIILICSKKLLKNQMKKLNYNFRLNEIDVSKISKLKKNNIGINLIDVKFNFKSPFDKISSKSNAYINNCCNLALEIVKKYNLKILINGPISKSHFLQKKFIGMTEFFASKTKSVGKEVMLIYNKHLSVSPITTHLPLKEIFKKITVKKIVYNSKVINNFYKSHLKRKPKILFTGLNPHCETTSDFSEEKKIIGPAIKKLRRMKISAFGPLPADTIFLKENYKKYDVIIGMYHDQVLTPIKTLYGFKAINITLGLPFLRITPDHGPNNNMLGKNKSDPNSLIEIINFVNSINAN